MKVTATLKNEKEIEAKFRQLRDGVRGKALEDAARAGALDLQAGMKERAPKKTTNLARSIHIETVKRTDTAVEVAAGTDLEYAAIQEYGGVIKPKNATWLAIPITEAARAVVSPRNFTGTLHFRGKKGSGSAALIDDAGQVQYALKKSVTIPAQPYARPTLDEDGPKAQASVARALKTLLRRLTR